MPTEHPVPTERDSPPEHSVPTEPPGRPERSVADEKSLRGAESAMQEPAGPVWVDSHCHLKLETCDGEVAAARRAGVAGIIVIGTDVADSREAIAVAGRHDGLGAAVGVHPHEAASGIEGLADLLGCDGVVAVGECGLDYHYDHSPRPDQRRVFARQIALAHTAGLALVVHSRSAWDDTFAILSTEGMPDRTVLHCFTGGPAEAERALAAGAYLSFSGIVSFPKAPDVREAAALCPADRLLVETDAPFLAPVPVRGKPNSPANLPLVGAALAAARGEPVRATAEATTANARQVFGVDLPPPT